MDIRDSERKAIVDIFTTLVEKGKLSSSDVRNGLLDTVTSSSSRQSCVRCSAARPKLSAKVSGFARNLKNSEALRKKIHSGISGDSVFSEHTGNLRHGTGTVHVGYVACRQHNSERKSRQIPHHVLVAKFVCDPISFSFPRQLAPMISRILSQFVLKYRYGARSISSVN
jgi:hypothetical protein